MGKTLRTSKLYVSSCLRRVKFAKAAPSPISSAMLLLPTPVTVQRKGTCMRASLAVVRVCFAGVLVCSFGIGGAFSAAASDSAGTVTDTLSAGQQLAPTHAIKSHSGIYKAVMQKDGNFVEYGSNGPLWSSQTHAGAQSHAAMQSDGNLVVYSSSEVAGWSSSTAPSSGDRLVMQDDGNLVLYSSGDLALWSSMHGRSNNGQDSLGTGQQLDTNNNIRSLDGRFVAVLQGDGNLVEYGPGNAAQWSSGTATGSGSIAAMQADGNLVVYSPNRSAAWSSSTAPSSGDSLKVQNDGNLVIYDGSGRPLWSKGQLLTGAAPVDDYPAQWRNVPQDSVIDTWREYNRECTSFAAWRLHSRDSFEMPFNANANQWGPMAQARGYVVNSVPTVGSIAWTNAGSFGHVAFVQAVNGGTITTEDYNYSLNGTYAVHSNVAAGSYHYIHFAG